MVEILVIDMSTLLNPKRRLKCFKYPGRFFSRNISSSRSLHTITTIIGMTVSNPDFDSCRRKRVFFEHEKYDEEPERNKEISCYN